MSDSCMCESGDGRRSKLDARFQRLIGSAFRLSSCIWRVSEIGIICSRSQSCATMRTSAPRLCQATIDCYENFSRVARNVLPFHNLQTLQVRSSPRAPLFETNLAGICVNISCSSSTNTIGAKEMPPTTRTIGEARKRAAARVQTSGDSCHRRLRSRLGTSRRPTIARTAATRKQATFIPTNRRRPSSTPPPERCRVVAPAFFPLAANFFTLIASSRLAWRVLQVYAARKSIKQLYIGNRAPLYSKSSLVYC